MTATWLIAEMTMMDWVLFFLASALIFGILGPRLRKDMQAWRKGRASARAVDGQQS